jgi:hypothetical protein
MLQTDAPHTFEYTIWRNASHTLSQQWPAYAVVISDMVAAATLAHTLFVLELGIRAPLIALACPA